MTKGLWKQTLAGVLGLTLIAVGGYFKLRNAGESVLRSVLFPIAFDAVLLISVGIEKIVRGRRPKV
jgi:hypothetical protein